VKCFTSMSDWVIDQRFAAVGELARKSAEAAGGGALCVYFNGVPVLDVWAGERDPTHSRAWNYDTMAMSWSTTKGVTSTALHMLADWGLLSYDAPVASYWPEFAANQKATVTVRQFMAMQAGLYDVRHLIDDPRDLLDHDTMAAALAAARPCHEPGRASAYHAFTYGWIAGELVRRITGSTLGEFVRREIAEPLQLDGCFIGTPAAEFDRVAARPALKPESRSVRRVAKAVDPLTRLVGFSPARFAAAFLPCGGNAVVPTAEFLEAEVPAVNGVFTARSLARMYAALGSDNGLDGVRLWSPTTRALATQPQRRRRDLIVPIRMSWRLGYHQPFPTKHTSVASFGFYGAYGSGGYADPDRQLAVGFVVQHAKGLPLIKLARAINAAVDGRS
jgi:CubicO group peptidase (beta-lactamase class C family)